MAIEKVDFVTEFFDDLKKINGERDVEWKASLLLRMGRLFDELPDYKWEGSWTTGKTVNLSSNIWSANWLTNLEIKLWYSHDGKERTMLLAEHPKTLADRTARAIALERAEANLQLPLNIFKDPTP